MCIGGSMYEYNVEARNTYTYNITQAQKSQVKKTHENIYVCMPTDGLEAWRLVGD